jgi:hypothetical protein
MSLYGGMDLHAHKPTVCPTFQRIPTKQKRRSTGQGAKNSLDPQRPEKTWVPADASGHELSRPKRVS